MEKTAPEPERQTVFISHGDCLADAEFVAEEIRRRFGTRDIHINYVGPVIGSHSGPGTVALFFTGSPRSRRRTQAGGGPPPRNLWFEAGC